MPLIGGTFQILARILSCTGPGVIYVPEDVGAGVAAKYLLPWVDTLPGNAFDVEWVIDSSSPLVLNSTEWLTIGSAPAGFTPTDNLKAVLSWLVGNSEYFIKSHHQGAIAPDEDLIVMTSGAGEFLSALANGTTLFEMQTAPVNAHLYPATAGAVPGYMQISELNSFRYQGNYVLSIWWWLLPDVTPCGDRNTRTPRDSDSHLVYASEQPPTPAGAFGEFRKLDPDDPDAAPTPVITSIEPNHGHAGTDFVILGSGFGDGATVQFDGVDATDIDVRSQYEIRGKAPAHALGAAAVQVTNPDGVTSAP